MLFQATPSPADNPRERLTSLGASALTSAELIAVLLGAGSPSRSVFDLSRELSERGLVSLSQSCLLYTSPSPRD